MSEEIPEVNNILNQLKSINTRPAQSPDDVTLSSEELDQFVVDKTAQLVNRSMEILDEFRDFLTATPGQDTAAAMAELINASTGAIETMSKIAINNKKLNNAVKIKDMEIKARKEIAKDDNTTKLLLSRQDLMQMLKAADDPIDITATSTPVD